MRTSLLLAMLLCLAACSSQPQASPPQPVKAAEAPAAPAKSRLTSVATTPGGVKIPSGYKLVVREGQQLYCRKETIVGSRFPETICLDEAGLKDLENRGQSARDDLNQSESKCVGTNCGGP